VSGGGDKVEQGVDAVVAEARVTLDARLFGEDVVVLALEVPDDLLERKLVVDVVPEPRRVYDRQRNTNTIFLEFWRKARGERGENAQITVTHRR
jgi:hypothetical protein